MEKTIRTESVDQFLDAIMCLDEKEELYQFFDRLAFLELDVMKVVAI